MIVKSNSWTLAHERHNAEWVRKKQVGIVIGSYGGIADAVKELLAPENYRQYHARVAATRNLRGVRNPGSVGRDSLPQPVEPASGLATPAFVPAFSPGKTCSHECGPGRPKARSTDLQWANPQEETPVGRRLAASPEYEG
ncbi:MAG: hypothetical protein LAQ69_17935 [Acidobacteriia bacterium]|nr:hypothetical protein [Terriglobia bacterium]